jgi:hypothetical protein
VAPIMLDGRRCAPVAARTLGSVRAVLPPFDDGPANSMFEFLSTIVRRATRVSLLCALAGLVGSISAYAQFQAARAALTPSPAASLPEPIYWKQSLFLIPYQWSSAADPGAAQAVLLFVSKDRGASWQKISEARPQVKAFNYHADGDGDYCFALRTIDHNGQAQPPGPYGPELRVIVDTTMPRIESLAAHYRSDGALQIQWRGSDANLDPTSWKFEVQLEGSETWQPLAGIAMMPIPGSAAAGPPGTSEGLATWQPPPGVRPRALRATVYDRAGNSAAYGAAIAGGPAAEAVATPTRGDSPPTTVQGWVSPSEAPRGTQSSTVPASQPITGAIARAPFRLSDGATSAPGEPFTSFGNPIGIGTPLSSTDTLADGAVPGPEQASQRVSPLQPHREATAPVRRASLTRLPMVDGSPAPPLTDSTSQASSTNPLGTTPTTFSLPPGVTPKHVGSRTFALEYELEDFGRGGIAKVELWGTRDGGQTWRLFTSDSDHRTPIIVTVDDAGTYGFRILAESAAGPAAHPPRAGEAPELWVDVDLHQPVVELTSVQLGDGNLADQLLIQWRADDDNLDSRPIALFYSSRPAGPWTAVATNLANTGYYAWQLPRYLPERFYLRIEARDSAGNLAAFQTREPVVISTSPPTARLRDAATVGPASVGSDGAYR